MNRKEFIKRSAISVLSSPIIMKNNLNISESDSPIMDISPLAITMWDFSWLERRWSGAGYENWDKILDELLERGYNAIRIDAFPHLVSENPNKEWTLKPVWRVQDWGSPALNKVRIQPALNEFISKCKDRDIKIGLSSWYREDIDNTRMKILSPEIMAQQWISTLKSIDRDNLLDNIFFVDLCNEWPGDLWAPYFTNNPKELSWGGWHTNKSMNWMKKSINIVRTEFPELPLGYSIEMHNSNLNADKDLPFFDYQEPHIWMSNSNNGEFYKKVGYKYDLINFDSYDSLILNGETVYNSNKEYWQNILYKAIDFYINYGRKNNFPLITTECWGVVDFKDWPLLNWDWVKELCKLGTIRAINSGQWIAIATSNFCGPQFTGMWKDVIWHQELTTMIKKSLINKKLTKSLIVNRIREY